MSNKRKKPSNTFWTLVIMLVINLIAKLIFSLFKKNTNDQRKNKKHRTSSY